MPLLRACPILAFVFVLVAPPVGAADAPDAARLVQAAFDYWRGKASTATIEMVIHRPEWQRRMTMQAWTLGQGDSLVRITAPLKDRGNGTLKKGRQMWTYNPKVDRVIKLPPSMMSQSWMGSDFSNDDLAKTDSLIGDYTHRITGTGQDRGLKVYQVESVPRPGAPVVWGLQRLHIREDLIFLREMFYDEEHRLVKTLEALEIVMLGGRLFPRRWRMHRADDPDAHTELIYHALEFSDTLPERLFTLANLKNPRR